ncbi:MAG TPA: hypothetical protein VLN46_02310 [Gillisia sp.]|nr:hypothetical protein [Gillisia sp.]
MLHDMVFKPTSGAQRTGIRIRDLRNYQRYSGKIIRKITIETLDPFGYSVYDTVSKPGNWAESVGNAIHKSTNNGTIRDLLLIEKNTPLDTLLLKESERLIRSQKYVRSVLIIAEFPEAKVRSDSVDLTVRVLDSWSLMPEAAFSTSRNMIGIRERNFIGTGHEVGFRYTTRLEDGKNGIDTYYTIPNFKNTFIRSTVAYRTFLNDAWYKGVNVERIFYSPFTRWAGGVYIDQQLRKDSLPDVNSQLSYESRSYNTYDLWVGHSYPIFKGNSESDRTTNLITSARYLNVDYKERPSADYDSIGFFSSKTFYMGSIGIASRQFVQDQYIFDYGVIEDVPVGTIYGITGGYQRKNDHDRLYLGAKIAYGNYFSWGFLSTHFDYGTFFRNNITEQTTYSFQANYFTHLFDINPTWKMRQFIKPQIIWGKDRLNSIGDRITINEYGNLLGIYGSEYNQMNVMGIPGFHSSLYGTRKFLLTLQTQFYAPWNVIGFRLNPFVNYTMAIVGNEDIHLGRSKIFSSIGAGVIISNDYMVFNTFQFSFAYYPEIPGRGDDVFRMNAFNTSDFGLQDFDFGKPRTVLFK